jgi:hypothetical protein
MSCAGRPTHNLVGPRAREVSSIQEALPGMRKIPVFLSYPSPFLKRQRRFVEGVTRYLEERGLDAQTLGTTEYDLELPLRAVRRMLLESHGVLTIALRRYQVAKGTARPGSDLEIPSEDIGGEWLTSPWCHIEPAMAYQLGLPVLVLRERGVRADGLLERGILDVYLPEFDLDKPIAQYFKSAQWRDLVSVWERHVRNVALAKGTPPKLF